MKEQIIAFLSSRTNLTIFQCMLYLMIGFIIGKHLTWHQMGIMFIILFLIQFITRTKAVADGMMFRQIMIDSQVDANNIVKKMKEVYDIDKNGVDKDEWN